MSDLAVGDIVYHPLSGFKMTVERIGWLGTVSTVWFQKNPETGLPELKRDSFREEDLRRSGLAEEYQDRDILNG